VLLGKSPKLPGGRGRTFLLNVRVASANSRNVRAQCLSAAERSRPPNTSRRGSSVCMSEYRAHFLTTKLPTRHSFASAKRASNCSIIQSGRSSQFQWPHPSAMPQRTSSATRFQDSICRHRIAGRVDPVGHSHSGLRSASEVLRRACAPGTPLGCLDHYRSRWPGI
jgi:hypothetical protein